MMPMVQPIRITDIVAEPHLAQFNSMKSHQIDWGGRAGYKSSKNAIKIAMLMLQDPTAECVVVRQDKIDHRKSTFRDLLIAFEERLGYKLEVDKNYPRGRSGTLWIQLPKGNMIHFEQMDYEKAKGFRPSGANRKIKIVWYFEITEYEGEDCINQSNAGYDRGAKDWMIHLYECNIPRPGHWVHDWVAKMRNHPDAYVKETYYDDAPAEQQEAFLGKMLLREINNLKKIDYDQYMIVYKGAPDNLVGLIYKLFDEKKHVRTVSRKGEDYMKLMVGVDYGETDATSFVLTGLKKNFQGMSVLKQYWHQNGTSKGFKTIEEYTADFFQFMEEATLEFNKPIRVFIDNAEKTIIEYWKREQMRRRARGFIIERANKQPRLDKKEAIEERIKTLNIMCGAEYVEIDASCTRLIKAIQMAERDKQGKRKDDGTTDVNSLDAFEYSWLDDIPMIHNVILRTRYADRIPEKPRTVKQEEVIE